MPKIERRHRAWNPSSLRLSALFSQALLSEHGGLDQLAISRVVMHVLLQGVRPTLCSLDLRLAMLQGHLIPLIG